MDARRALLRIVALTLGAALALAVVPLATSAAAISITEPSAGATVGPAAGLQRDDRRRIRPRDGRALRRLERLGNAGAPGRARASGGIWSVTDETRRWNGPIHRGRRTGGRSSRAANATSRSAPNRRRWRSKGRARRPATPPQRSAAPPAKANRSRSRSSQAPKRAAPGGDRGRPSKWELGPGLVDPGLSEGEYTAIAVEPSSLGRQPRQKLAG